MSVKDDRFYENILGSGASAKNEQERQWRERSAALDGEERKWIDMPIADLEELIRAGDGDHKLPLLTHVHARPFGAIARKTLEAAKRQKYWPSGEMFIATISDRRLEAVQKLMDSDDFDIGAWFERQSV